MNAYESAAIPRSSTRILVLGGTGLIGFNLIKEIATSIFDSKIYAIVRHELPVFRMFEDSDKLELFVEPDTEKWEILINQMEPFDTIFTAIGTTVSNSNGIQGQRIIDHDLNIKLLSIAKRVGVKNCCLVSSMNNIILSNLFAYFALKKEIEQDVIILGFEKTIILRPGPLAGDRSTLNQHQTFKSLLSSLIATMTYNTPCSAVFGYSIQASQVAEAAVFLLETMSTSEGPVQYVNSHEMFCLAEALNSI